MAVCPVCGVGFSPARADNLYCSRACKQKFYRASRSSPSPSPHPPDLLEGLASEVLLSCESLGVDPLALVVALQEVQLHDFLLKLPSRNRLAFVSRLVEWSFSLDD